MIWFLEITGKKLSKWLHGLLAKMLTTAVQKIILPAIRN
jgi:hypothetical protein